jgi:hypothetical protein
MQPPLAVHFFQVMTNSTTAVPLLRVRGRHRPRSRYIFTCCHEPPQPGSIRREPRPALISDPLSPAVADVAGEVLVWRALQRISEPVVDDAESGAGVSGWRRP